MATSGRGKPVPPREHARRHRIWNASSNLSEAAKRMELTPAGALLWARSQGLASKRHAKALSPQEHARRRRALKKWPVGEAARHLGLNVDALRAYRYKHDLPHHRGGGPRIPASEEQRRRRAHAKTRTDAKAAKRLGLPLSTYRGWRISRGLPSSRT